MPQHDYVLSMSTATRDTSNFRTTKRTVATSGVPLQIIKNFSPTAGLHLMGSVTDLPRPGIALDFGLLKT